MLDEGVVEPEDFAELLVVHIGEPGFARAHGHVRDGFLCLEKRVDFFFERSLGDEPVDLHVARLPDTEGAVGGLRFDGGVPPQVVMDDLRCGGEVEARSARLEREDEHLAFGVLLEVLDHGGALRLRASAVVEVRAEPEFFRDGLFEQGGASASCRRKGPARLLPAHFLLVSLRRAQRPSPVMRLRLPSGMSRGGCRFASRRESSAI